MICQFTRALVDKTTTLLLRCAGTSRSSAVIRRLKQILALTLAVVLLTTALQWLVPLSLALAIAAVVVFLWLERRLLFSGMAVPRSVNDDAALYERLGAANPRGSDDFALQCEIVRRFEPSFSPRGYSRDYVRGRFDAIAAAQLPQLAEAGVSAPLSLWQEIGSILRRSESLKLLFSSAFVIACAVALIAGWFLLTTELGNVGLKRVIEIAVPAFTGHRLRIGRLRVTPKFYRFVFEHRRFFARADVKSLLAFLEDQPRSTPGGAPDLVIEGARLESRNLSVEIELLRLQTPSDLRVYVKAEAPERGSARVALAFVDLELSGTYAARGWLLPVPEGSSPGLELITTGTLTGAAGKYLASGTALQRDSRAEYRLSADIKASAAHLRLHGDPLEMTADAAEKLSEVSAIDISPGVIGIDVDAALHARQMTYSYRFQSTQPPVRLRAQFSAEIPPGMPQLFERRFRWRHFVPRSADISFSGENIGVSKIGRERLRRLGWQLAENTIFRGETRIEMTGADSSGDNRR